MKYACNQSAPLPLTVPLQQYLYGTNEGVYIYDTRETVIPLADVMRVFKHPDAKLALSRGAKVDYIMSRKFSIPVNKENVLKYGILDAKFADQIPDEIILSIPESKSYLTKPELFMLDLLDGYNWDRPLHLLGMGGDLNMGIKEYLMFEGFSYKFVPIKTGCRRADPGIVDADDLYNKMKNVFSWKAISAGDWFVDYQNLYTFCGVMNYRDLFAQVAAILNKEGRHQQALEILDMGMEVMPEKSFPYDMVMLSLGNELAMANLIEQYYIAGAPEKAGELALEFTQQLLKSISYFGRRYDVAKDEFETAAMYLYYVTDDILTKHGAKDLADFIQQQADEVIESIG